MRRILVLTCSISLCGYSTFAQLIRATPQQVPNRVTATGSPQSSSAGSKVQLNPQPYPPKARGVQTVRKPSAKLNPATLKLSAKLKNPAGAQADAALIGLLRTQRQSADSEAAQMKLLPAQGAPERTSSQMLGNRIGTASVRVQSNSAPPKIGQGKISSASGTTSLLTKAPTPINGAAMLCAKDPTMRILQVNGNSSAHTFTPDSRYNFYTITGCSFGDPAPNAKVYVYYQSTFHQQFQIQEWNNNGIKLNLNSNLTGLLDQNDLTLVVQRADGKQVSMGGFKFYAARETVPLEHFPQRDFHLNTFTVNKIANLKDQYFSPSEQGVSSSFPKGWTAAVNWFLYTAPLQSDEDVYSFHDLVPGFYPDSAQAGEIDLGCDSPLQRVGTFDLKWDAQNALHVVWQGQECDWHGDPDTFVDREANYVMSVWVTGPRGIDPWTGKPVSAGSAR